MYRLRPQTVYFQIEFIVPAHAFEIYYSHHGFLSKYPLSESISISIKAAMRFTRIRLCFPSVCRDAITISDAAKLQFRDRWNNFAAVCVCVCVCSKGRIPRFVSYTLYISRTCIIDVGLEGLLWIDSLVRFSSASCRSEIYVY